MGVGVDPRPAGAAPTPKTARQAARVGSILRSSASAAGLVRWLSPELRKHADSMVTTTGDGEDLPRMPCFASTPDSSGGDDMQRMARFASAPDVRTLDGMLVGTREEVLATLKIQAAVKPWVTRRLRLRRRFASAPDVDSLEAMLVGTRSQVLATLTIQTTAREWLFRHGGRQLHRATSEGQTADCLRLIASRANLEQRIGGETPLLVSARLDRRVVAAFLIEAGADQAVTDVDGFSPILWAAFHGHCALAQLLLDAHADTEAVDNDGNTPLVVAAFNGHGAAVRVLLDSAELRGEPCHGCEYALAVARARRDEELVRMLSDQSDGSRTVAPTTVCIAKPLVQYERGSELHWACTRGDAETVERLLTARADLECCCGVELITPLHAAIRGRHETVVRLLLKASANTEAQQADGSTPLHIAADSVLSSYQDPQKSLALIKLLYDYGANPQAARHDGKTAVDVSRAAFPVATSECHKSADREACAAGAGDPAAHCAPDGVSSMSDLVDPDCRAHQFGVWRAQCIVRPAPSADIPLAVRVQVLVMRAPED